VGGGGGIDLLEQANQLRTRLPREDHYDRTGAVSTVKTGFLTCIASVDVQWLERAGYFFAHLRTGSGGARGENRNREQHDDKASTSEHCFHLQMTTDRQSTIDTVFFRSQAVSLIATSMEKSHSIYVGPSSK
jgi:hypothetical protein